MTIRSRARVTGSIKLDGRDIYDPSARTAAQLRARIAWCSRNRTRSRNRSTTRRLRSAHPWPGAQRAQLDDIVCTSLSAPDCG